MNKYTLPIDLHTLECERNGQHVPPKYRHASEQARNEFAARDKRERFEDGNAAEFPQQAPDVAEHMLSKGYTVGAVNEHMRDLAKHEPEKSQTLSLLEHLDLIGRVWR